MGVFVLFLLFMSQSGFLCKACQAPIFRRLILLVKRIAVFSALWYNAFKLTKGRGL